MARQKTPVPMDAPQTIRVRERMKPQDQTIVVAKTAEGSLVEVRSGKEPLFIDSKMIRDATGQPITSHFHPWREPVDDKVAKSLKVGIAEQFVFNWVPAYQRSLSSARGLPRWEPVSKDKNEVYVPYAYGDKTDNYWHMGDTILHKRSREFDEAEKADKAYAQNIDRMLDNKSQELQEELGSMGAKKISQGFDEAPNDAVGFKQDADSVAPG